MFARIVPILIVVASLGRAAVADEAEAKALFLRGKAKYERGDFAGAAAAFIAASKESPRADLYFNVARAFEKGGRPAAAVPWYQRYLFARPDAPDRREIEEAMSADLAQAGHLELRVRIAGARVTVDEEEAGTAPLRAAFDLDPGAHVVRVIAPASPPRDFPVRIETGRTVPLDVDDVGARREEAARPASPRSGRLKAAAWAVGGIAAASLGGGLAFGLLAREDASAVERAANPMMPPPWASVADQADRGRTFANVGYALDAVGAAAAVTDVVLWMMVRAEGHK